MGSPLEGGREGKESRPALSPGTAIVQVPNFTILIKDYFALVITVKVSVRVVAVALTEGSRVRKEELSATTLEVPRDTSDKSWEGVFKNNCSTTFSVPKDKVAASCVVLEVSHR